MWDAEIALIALTPSEEATDANGFPNDPAESRRTLFANRKSVGHAEFYEANIAGMKAELKMDVYAEEYQGETLAEYRGKRYAVLRTYEHGGDYIELTLSDQSQGGAASGKV